MDMKPCHADDWSGFCHALEKMRSWQETNCEKLMQMKQHNNVIVETKKTAFLNWSGI